MIVIFGALPEEIKYIKKCMSLDKMSVYRHCRIYEGKFDGIDGLLVTTGMGKKKTILATEYVLNNYPVSLIISTGFAGGLNNKTTRGDIVVHSDLINENRTGEESVTDTSLYSDSSLVSVAKRLLINGKYPYLIGKGITVNHAQTTHESKYKLGVSYLADVVDMESYWIGQTANEKRVPFIVIRTVLDALNDDLSVLNSIMSEEKFVPSKAIAYFIKHLSQIIYVSKLLDDARKMGKVMAGFIREYIAEIQRNECT